MRLGIKLCFILLVMFGVASAEEFNNTSGMYENDSSIDAPSVGINEFSEGTESTAETPDVGFDENSDETATGDVVEAPAVENDTEEGGGFVEDSETGINEDPTIFEDDGFKQKPADEILEHFKKDEDESFALPSEIPLETEEASGQKPEAVQPNDSQESQGKEMTELEKKERDRQELNKLNDEYEKINQKKEELDLEFKAIEEERINLVKTKDGLKNNEDIMEYNKKAKALNEKLKQYDEKRKAHDEEVQDFNMRVKQDMERKIEEAEARNIETNYSAFDEAVDSFSEMNPYERLNIDESAPIEEQREEVLKYKARIEREYQMLMKQRSEIDKEKNSVKTVEDVNALNKKTVELNKRIVEYEKKRVLFDKELNDFNSRMEAQVIVQQGKVEEE